MEHERILIQIPRHLKQKLDILKTQGYTTSGFIRALLERELAHIKLEKPKRRTRIRLED